MGLNAKLVVVGGDIKTTEIDLKLPAIIGRGRGAGILLPHPLVSRQHCELFETDGCLMVRDLGSLNGTYIGQDKIGGEAPLPPGGLLTVGSVTFRAVYEGDDVNGENHGGRAGDTAIGLPAAAFGEETVPTDDVVVVADAKPAPGPSIIPTVSAAKPVPVAPSAVVPAPPPAAPAPPPPAAAVGPPPAAEHDDERAEAAEAEDDFQSFLKSLDGK